MRNFAFLKKIPFSKSYFCDVVLRKSRCSSVDVFYGQLLWKVTALKKFLFSRFGSWVEVSFWTSRYSGEKNAGKKWLFWKRSSPKKASALKKELLRKSNSCDTLKKVTLKNCDEEAFPKIKLSENIAIWILNKVAKNDHAVLFVIKVLENSQENMHGVVLRF